MEVRTTNDGNDSRTTPAGDKPRRGATVGHLIRRGVAVVVLLALLVGAFLYWRLSDHSPKPQEAGPAAGPLEVRTTVVQKRNVPLEPRFLGQTEASQTVEIRSRVRGFLLERAFEEGQAVEEGQVLFRIDPQPFKEELALATARLASAGARLARADQQLKRYEELFRRGSVTGTELENWQAEQAVAAAEVNQEKARIAQAELNEGYTTIRSPLKGVIGRAMKDVGSYVDDTNNGLLAVLQQVDPMYVRYPVSEQDILRFQRMEQAGEVIIPRNVKELELEIALADGRTYPHRGRVNFVDVQVATSTGTAVVRGTVPNPDAGERPGLRPGQFVHATVLGMTRVGVIVVPQRAVVQTPAGPSVYVVNDKGVVEQRPVEVGEWQDDDWVIEKGLRPGEQVVVDRLMQVRPGTAVAIAPAAADREGEAPAEPRQAAHDRSAGGRRSR